MKVKKLICITGIILIACTVTGDLFAAETDTAQTAELSHTEDKREEDVFILKIENEASPAKAKEMLQHASDELLTQSRFKAVRIGLDVDPV